MFLFIQKWKVKNIAFKMNYLIKTPLHFIRSIFMAALRVIPIFLDTPSLAHTLSHSDSSLPSSSPSFPLCSSVIFVVRSKALTSRLCALTEIDISSSSFQPPPSSYALFRDIPGIVEVYISLDQTKFSHFSPQEAIVSLIDSSDLLAAFTSSVAFK